MSASQELIGKVRELAKGTPYVVDETSDGFDVRLDIADARCYTLLLKEGIEKTFIHHVKLDESTKSLMIADDSRELSWKIGKGLSEPSSPPNVTFSAERTVGRIYEFGARKEFAWNERGQYGKVLDFAFNSNEGRGLVRASSEDLG